MFLFLSFVIIIRAMLYILTSSFPFLILNTQKLQARIFKVSFIHGHLSNIVGFRFLLPYRNIRPNSFPAHLCLIKQPILLYNTYSSLQIFHQQSNRQLMIDETCEQQIPEVGLQHSLSAYWVAAHQQLTILLLKNELLSII